MRTPGSDVARRRAGGARAVGLLVTALTLPWVAPGGAVACGHCVEDKVAATYDYGVVTRARARGHRVYVFELRGPLRPGDEAARQAVAAAVAAAPGVDAGTVRVALDPPAVSCASDPATRPATRLPQAARAGLARHGLTLRYVTAIDR